MPANRSNQYSPAEAKKLLPAAIPVRITEDNKGSLLAYPESALDRVLVACTNEYNGACDLYLQYSQDIDEFLDDYPDAAYVSEHSGERQINDNAVIMMDSWVFRHLVGGQSD